MESSFKLVRATWWFIYRHLQNTWNSLLRKRNDDSTLTLILNLIYTEKQSSVKWKHCTGLELCGFSHFTVSAVTMWWRGKLSLATGDCLSSSHTCHLWSWRSQVRFLIATVTVSSLIRDSQVKTCRDTGMKHESALCAPSLDLKRRGEKLRLTNH